MHGVLRWRGTMSVVLEDLDEGIRRNRNLPDLLHLLFALFLFVEKFALPADVTAIAFRGDVLSHFANVVAGDDLAADRGLDRDLEHLRRNDLGELFAELAAFAFGFLAVHD